MKLSSAKVKRSIVLTKTLTLLKKTLAKLSSTKFGSFATFYGKILALKSYFMAEILRLNDQIKAYKINDNVHKLTTGKSEDLILMRERMTSLISKNVLINYRKTVIS